LVLYIKIKKYIKSMSYINDWIWLHIPCPVEGCKNNDVTYWAHRNCPYSSKDHDVKINSAGYLKCNACNKKGELIRWRFDCGCGKHGFKEITNLNRLVEVLQVMARATTDQAFIGRLMGAVSVMFLNQNN
jgi:hypothetical protein